jgi:hypothetical protein
VGLGSLPQFGQLELQLVLVDIEDASCAGRRVASISLSSVVPE